MKEKIEYAPIALFCYARTGVLKKTVEALQQNKESKESRLFIFSDGYKNENDEKQVQEVRKYIHSIKGFKEIQIIEAEKNKGLARSIIDGVTQVVNKFGKIIVVEDDIYSSPYFLKFMNDALCMYENDDEVGCIGAHTPPINLNKQTFFLKGSNCWGWATWKRSWALFEEDTQKLLNEIKAKHLEKKFDYNGTYNYMQMLQDQIDGKVNSWAIRWYASLFLSNKLCLQPGLTLVKNIGFGVENSTHCTDSHENQIYNNEMNMQELVLEKITPPHEDIQAYKAYCKFNKHRQKLLSFSLYKHPWERLLSLKYTHLKQHRVLTILGMKFKWKEKK